ncbi:acid protease [Russula ochroleuca]|uniref:Acid protease n=1 Tax=Russula ochroleuca TaxID=152965 RepID=A0A9P5K131_9AGAM|nr:acid protease [Russula ochroleuca]
MYFSFAVALAAFPFLVGAVPVENSRRNVLSIPLSKRGPSQLDVRSLHAGTHHTMAKFQRGFEAFERNTGKRHPLAPKHGRLDKRSTPGNASIPLTDFHEFMWYGTIQVGTPSKEYSVNIDTGSANLFLPGPSCQSCQGHTIYDPSNSSTAKDLGLSANLTYALGNVAGHVFADTVNLGGLEASNGTLVVASDVAVNFNATNFGADGTLGMGLRGLSPFNATTIFETLVEENQLEEPVFGLVLAESNSELIIGGRDSSRFKGNLSYTPVDSGMGYWHTKFDNITINGNDIQINNTEVIIDTGNVLLLGDQISIGNIYKGIPGSARFNSSDPSFGSQFWTFPCNTTVNASISFDNTPFDISPDIFNLGTIGGGLCVGAFAEFPAGATYPGFWVLGDVFLRNVYTEFDYGSNGIKNGTQDGKVQIGFAQLA